MPPPNPSPPTPGPKSTATREYYSSTGKPLESADPDISELSESTHLSPRSFPPKPGNITTKDKDGYVDVSLHNGDDNDAKGKGTQEERRASDMLLEEEDMQVSMRMMEVDAELKRKGARNEERVRALDGIREEMMVEKGKREGGVSEKEGEGDDKK